MAWKLYDCLDARGQNIIADWFRQLQKPELARFNQKLDTLALNGHELCPGLAANLHNASHLHKIKINGRVAARLLLCCGPIQMETEYTLLLGVFERDGKLPFGALDIAERHRREIIADIRRRCPHERITK